MIPIPIKPNKRKVKGYYKVFFKSKTKDIIKVWNFLDALINKLGNPFKKKTTGRPPKFKDMRIYTKICILIGYFDFTIDEVAGFLPLLAKQSLDRSNIDRWFQRMNIEYIERTSEFLNKKLEDMFDYGEYIVDATKYAATEYHEAFHKGETTYELDLIGLHILVNYFFKEGFVSIVKFHVSDGWSHESPIFREKLLSKVNLKPHRRIHGDKGFASEENFEMLFEKDVIPNICQKDGAKGKFWTKKAKKLYNNNLRKQIRGLVETVFGGMQTETNNRVRFKLDKTRKLYVGIVLDMDYIIYKEPSQLHTRLERNEIRKLSMEAKKKFTTLRAKLKAKAPKRMENQNYFKKFCYIFSDRYVGYATNGVASYWVEGLSLLLKTEHDEEDSNAMDQDDMTMDVKDVERINVKKDMLLMHKDGNLLVQKTQIGLRAYWQTSKTPKFDQKSGEIRIKVKEAES